MAEQIKLGDCECESKSRRVLEIYIYIQNNKPNEKRRFGANYIKDAMQLNIYLYYDYFTNFKNMGSLFSIYSCPFGCSGDQVFVEMKTLNME